MQTMSQQKFMFEEASRYALAKKRSRAKFLP